MRLQSSWSAALQQPALRTKTNDWVYLLSSRDSGQFYHHLNRSRNNQEPTLGMREETRLMFWSDAIKKRFMVGLNDQLLTYQVYTQLLHASKYQRPLSQLMKVPALDLSLMANCHELSRIVTNCTNYHEQHLWVLNSIFTSTAQTTFSHRIHMKHSYEVSRAPQ